MGARAVTIGAAMGVALSDDAYSTAEEMLHAADIAMYQAKRRNRQAPAWGLDGTVQVLAD
jgi:GGDEF domain-containing protein